MTKAENILFGVFMGIFYFTLRVYRGMSPEDAIPFGVSYGLFAYLVRWFSFAAFPRKTS